MVLMWNFQVWSVMAEKKSFNWFYFYCVCVSFFVHSVHETQKIPKNECINLQKQTVVLRTIRLVYHWFDGCLKWMNECCVVLKRDSNYTIIEFQIDGMVKFCDVEGQMKYQLAKLYIYILYTQQQTLLKYRRSHGLVCSGCMIWCGSSIIERFSFSFTFYSMNFR